MGELYLSVQEQDALTGLDLAAVDMRIKAAIATRDTGPLRELALERCGDYVAAQARAFERAVRELGGARTDKKVLATREVARRAGSDLSFAVDHSRQRLATQLAERDLFVIDDTIPTPFRLDERLRVRVHYQWRPSNADSWRFGSIEFTYAVPPEPLWHVQPTSRRPSTAARERERQEQLLRVWDHLRRQALESVQAFFRKGHDPTTIPAVFEARPSPHGGGLDNYSADFWRTPQAV